MSNSTRELEERLTAVEDPLIGADVVSLGLVNEIEIDDGTAHVSLAFNTPFAPSEVEIGNRIREVVVDAGLEPDLRAQAGGRHGFDEEIMPEVRNVIAVASGKGGVGKTTVAANLATGFADLGARVGVLDADIHGPNVPTILPVDEEPGATPDEDKLVPPVYEGVKVMSMGFLLRNQDDPAIMRGPMVNRVMTHFMENVEWGQLDYLIVDLPPGTGDASLDLLQQLPVTGTVIVTTPQEMAVHDARKGLRLFETHDTPVLGVVENMSAYRCPNCGDEHDPFGRGGAAEIADQYDVTLLPTLPIHADFGADGSDAPVVLDEESPVREPTVELVEQVIDRIGEVNRRTVAEHVGVLPEADEEGEESEPTEEDESADEARPAGSGDGSTPPE